jgi:signal transduction histidine kinase/DNA-binding NarL/FixJ family response regulator
VIELASLRPFSEVNRDFLDRLTDTIGVVLNTIRANMRTEELLAQSQSLTQELQKQSEELRETNDELQEKARLLIEQNRDIEVKNEEIEFARRGLEEKAAQLALSSKYKSEFLANMSHELRTPLNSMLILSRLLAENEDGSLSEKQVDFAQTIHSAGNDLLSLINDILDLSKVEAGRMELDMAPVALADIYEDAERAFRQVAEQNKLAYAVEIDAALPPSIVTDEQRLGQILKNLLSNAFKFTHVGGVTLSIGYARKETNFASETLRTAEHVICFEVTDTGVGIADDKLMAIFEAFQQADGTTSRKYGGTGLGLSISREIARLLGGEIHVDSELGRGSRFTLHLPLTERPVETQPEDREIGGEGGQRGQGGEGGEGGHPNYLPHPLIDGPQTSLARTVGGAPADGGESTDDRLKLEPDQPVVLVIDSDLPRAAAMLDMVRAQGAGGVVARRATAALGLAREHRPRAVLLTGDTPRAESVLAQLKKHPDTRHVPVVMIGRDASRVAALRAGAAAFLAEPLEADELQETFERLERMSCAPARIALVAEPDEVGDELAELIAGDRGRSTTSTRRRRSTRSRRSRSTSRSCSSAAIAAEPSRCCARSRPTRRFESVP